MGGENVCVEGSYGNGECVMLDNILANVITWEYTFSVTPTLLSFGATGATKYVTATSYKRKYLNGSYTGQQVDVGFSSSASGSGFSSSGTSVRAEENTTTTGRSGTVTFTQYESDKTDYISCNQDAGTVHYNYTLKPPFLSLTIHGSIADYEIRFKTYKNTYINGSHVWEEEVSGGGISFDSVQWDPNNIASYLQIDYHGDAAYLTMYDAPPYANSTLIIRFKNYYFSAFATITFEVYRI